jgi:hypothetical protein
MNGHTRPTLLAVICILAAALTASRAGAETAAAPAGQSTSPSPAPAVAAETTQGAGCNTIRKPASAGGASIVQDTGESLQHKSWQPIGGEIQFTVKSFVAIPPDASVLACFRWKSIPESTNDFIETRPSRLDLNGDGKLLKVTTTVPDGLGPQPNDVAKALPLVPLAEVRILVIDNKKKETAADVTTAIGITYPVAALAIAIATMILGFVVLYIAAGSRLKHLGILQTNWLLRIISTPSGFASLSQLQIVLWTFVVAASAVYVMSLSGQLIQITNGTLVLLGIAGAAGIGAKVHSEAQGATAEAAAAKAEADKAAADIIAAQKAAAAATPPADPVAAARVTAENNLAAAEKTAKATIASATRARADALKNPPATQLPRWSDLIVNESVKDDGTVTREIDVARFQMLLFTLITAAFVLMSVVTTYVIPEISTGFQTLMGISNGVYLGSKIAQGS